MPTDSLSDSRKRARRACRFCTRRKIRCTKELPECSSCTLHKRKCTYNERSRGTSRDVQDFMSETGDVELRSRNGINTHPLRSEESNGVIIRFLDYDVFCRSQARLLFPLRSSSATPDHINLLLRDAGGSRHIATCYYGMVHPWLPFISRRKVFNHMLNPLVPARVDTSFLILCMKLVTEPLVDQSPRTAEYNTAVQFFTDLQLAGIVSLEILQGFILLAVYEQGHAIFPAAQISIGVSLKYALALGMGWYKTSTATCELEIWAEKEEQRRTWWAIFVLERVAALGDPHQPLLTPEPNLTALLPCHDNDWDSQADVESHCTLSSPPETLGRFASVVQASYLLSRVFRHITDQSMDPEFAQTEMEQLQKTLYAMILYSESNKGTTYSILCYQTALSFCGILVLYASYQLNSLSPLHQKALDAADNAANLAVKVAEAYVEMDALDCTHGDVSPFVLPWLYKAGARLVQVKRMDNLSIIEDALGKLGKRWKAAGYYLKLLAAARIMEST